MGREESNDQSKSEELLAVEAAENAGSEEEAKAYKKRGWQHKLKMGQHYRMERFSVFFFSLFGMLLVLTGLAWNVNRISQNELIGTKALYSSGIEFSLSGVQGDVVNVFRNEDGTRAYVLLDMNDLSQVSLDTNDYELFVTGFNKGLSQEPSASMFLYGSSGYMGLEFYDERGLANEIFDITIRNNSIVTKKEDLTEEELAELEDATFGTEDQANFYVNVGAEEAVIMPALNRDLDPVELYYALVGHYDEEELFESIDENVKELKQLLAEHDEYAGRISGLGYGEVEKPIYMKGDSIDEDGNFVSKYTVVGAHEIEYIDRHATDGFVTQVVKDPSKLRDYMAKKRAVEQLSQESSSEDDPESLTIIDELVRDDGYTLVIDDISESDATSGDLSIRDSVNSLESLWGQYLTTKRELQIDRMRELLLLDAEIRTQSQSFSANTNEDFLSIY